MSAYTPGLWIAEDMLTPDGKHTGGYEIYENKEPGLFIAYVGCIGGENAAQLIAAAPDLLAALQSVCRCLEWHEKQHGVGMDAKALADAREAIAKATRGAA
jgi:hypothetical protein